MLQFMPAELRRLIADSFVSLSFPFGTVIVREGRGSRFPLRARVRPCPARVKRGEGEEEVPGRDPPPGRHVRRARARREHVTRSATVRASSDVEALRLDRSIFQALLKTHPEVRDSFGLHIRRRNLENFFRLYSAFARLPSDALALMLKELRPVEVTKGEVVVREGGRAGPMYVVEEGRLRAYSRSTGIDATWRISARVTSSARSRSSRASRVKPQSRR